jgi:hypothetical protein
VGINYGQVADNLPQPQHVSSLVQQLGFKMVKIYDTNETILNAFANTGTSVVVCVPNDEIISLAVSEVAARTWVHTNINPFFPATKITNIMVGNEVNFSTYLSGLHVGVVGLNQTFEHICSLVLLLGTSFEIGYLVFCHESSLLSLSFLEVIIIFALKLSRSWKYI